MKDRKRPIDCGLMLPPLNYSSPIAVLHEIDVSFVRGDGVAKAGVYVVGDPDNGGYEWVVKTPDALEHSDCGYGDSTVALMDGLAKWHSCKISRP